MASQCPKCHESVEEDAICCDGVEFQWRCAACFKRTRGFAIPFGRCPLCNGELKPIGEIETPTASRVQAVQEAVQIEVSAHLFYKRLAEAVDDPETSDFFESMATMEKGHADELLRKYHVHETEPLFKDAGYPLPYPFFEDLCFSAETGNSRRLYDCAIQLERRTYDFFKDKAAKMKKTPEKDLYLEFAAEELEHITLLETERDRFGEGRKS